MTPMRGLLPLCLLLAACGFGEVQAQEPQPADLETVGSTTSTAPAAAPPTTTTTAVPSAPTIEVEPPSGRQRLVIHGTGDVNLWERYAGTDPEATWAPLRDLFQNDDLTVVNLECAPSELGSPLPKAYNFRCPFETLLPMAEAGVDVANLANNHSQDFGSEAMLDGRANVFAAGLNPVGVGADLEQATEPAVFSIGGWTVAVVGFGGVVTDSSWLATPDRPGMASGDDGELMADTVRRADELADIVIVTIHWGWELETEPRRADVELAEAMVAAGADMIFGHHQHRLNPMTYIDGVPIAWGLGNFIWQPGTGDASRTAVAEVIVEPDGTIRGCLIPARIIATGVVELHGTSCGGSATPAGY